MEEEKKTILRKRPGGNLRLAGGVPVVRTAYARSILVGLFLSISHPCGMIVQTANLVDSKI